MALEVIPWARQHVYDVCRRYDSHRLDDLWAETIAALIRAVAYYQPDKGAFGPFARTAVHRACWRYVISGEISAQRAVGRRHERPLRQSYTSLDLLAAELEDGIWGDELSAFQQAAAAHLTAPSAESEALAREHVTLRIRADIPGLTRCVAQPLPAVSAKRAARAAG